MRYHLFCVLVGAISLLSSVVADELVPTELKGVISFGSGEAQPAKDVVIWVNIPGHQPSRLPRVEKMNQKDKEFEPRVLIAPTNTEVYFPNLDPIFHSIFSYNKVKKIDLGQYKGKGLPVMFEEPGIYPIGCEIHPWMSAFVVIVDTPFYGKTNFKGAYNISELVPGTYSFKVWSPKFKEQTEVEYTVKSGQNTFNWTVPASLLKKSISRKKQRDKKKSEGLY